MLVLADIAAFLDGYFEVGRYGADQGGIFRPSEQPVGRLGLALEPWPGLRGWAAQERLDAVFLHRPWKLRAADLGAGCGVVAYHLAFDERLTLGFNPELAAALGLHDLVALGYKEGRPIGMLGTTDRAGFGAFERRARAAFGGLERVRACAGPVERVAVVGAMTEALVREAAERGAAVYVTGQFRQPARAAVDELELGVIEVGHARSERWGLRTLATVLHERFAGLAVLIADA